MFCSLCGTSDPCDRDGCWIGQDGWEYEKARIVGFLRDNKGNQVNPGKPLMEKKSKAGKGLSFLPLNCDVKLGVKDRCPHCGQFHLRPGFCQAVHNPALRVDKGMDKLSMEAQIVHAELSTLSTPLTDPVVEPSDEELDAVARRRAYKAKHERERRARLKEGK